MTKRIRRRIYKDPVRAQEIGDLARDADDALVSLDQRVTTLEATEATPGTGSGDFVGPASSTNNHLVAFDGTTGKLGKDSGLSISDVTTLQSDVSAIQGDVTTLQGDVVALDTRVTVLENSTLTIGRAIALVRGYPLI